MGPTSHDRVQAVKLVLKSVSYASRIVRGPYFQWPNRSRHVFEPQNTESAPSAYWIRVCGIINLICMAFYLWWRFTRSLIGVKHIIWAFTFLAAECIMAIGMIVGHSSRSFPVHREKVGGVEIIHVNRHGQL